MVVGRSPAGPQIFFKNKFINSIILLTIFLRLVQAAVIVNVQGVGPYPYQTTCPNCHQQGETMICLMLFL